jgi:DNA-binding NarL/FixJ family response regulator
MREMQSSSRPKRVLVADDSPVIRERLLGILEDLGGVTVVGEAEDGRQALAMVEELHPDVVILDIRMANGSGIEALERIKRLEAAPVVAILTNYPYSQYRDRCVALGADFFFDKSNEFETTTLSPRSHR